MKKKRKSRAEARPLQVPIGRWVRMRVEKLPEMAGKLEEYRRKRLFNGTPEAGGA